MATTVHELRKLVAVYANAGFDYAALPERDKFLVDDAVKSGYKRYLYPPDPAVPAVAGVAYRWKFLTPYITLTTIAGQAEYAAPVGVSGLIGRFYDLSQSIYSPLENAGRGQLETARSFNRGPSRPTMACFDLLRVDETGIPLYQIIFHPTPESTYSFRVQVQLAPPELSDTYPNIVCDPSSSQCVEECVLAAWEMRWGDKSGVHEQMAQAGLIQAIAFDKSRSPEQYGYNADDGSLFVGQDWRLSGSRISGLITYDPALRYNP